MHHRAESLPALTETARSQAVGLSLSRLVEEARALLEAKKRLRIYDCDDTLISSESSITVHKDGEDLTMDSATFACFKPSAGDTLDFSDFNHVTHPRIIKKNFDAFRADVANPDNEVVILTARPKGSVSAIQAFMEAQGVKGVPVIALASSDPDDKGRWVADRAKAAGYTDVSVTDDSSANVASMTRFVKRTLNVDVKSVSNQLTKNADYEGPASPKQFLSKTPTQALVKYSKPGDHTPSEWWKAQSDEFQQHYCQQHAGSKYCRMGRPR